MQEKEQVVDAGAPATAHVVDSVLHTAMSIGRLMRQRVVGDQLEPAAYWVLKHLERGSMRITELASSTQLDTSTASRHVTQLERTGLVGRSQDPDDGRAQRIDLTPEGRDQLQASITRRRQTLAAVLEDWEAADLADLDRLLARLVAGIESQTHGDRPASTHPRTAPADREAS
ncbi:MarR family winged helix-turn-helix transcriptional regulator [Microlunatus flavus]|uniref:DNA-binding transcriptional regulator, MarR family n=1 Tax=Microlunatus flavus TaxID=1036181 RepID=A0A1H9K8N8_9ACTN|nr:MarR family transcriptional regulator [Microlunatus flavus]SEQ95494.1 DNA-binding transcriptional regulator, MarR family [Microlunatus flavus]